MHKILVLYASMTGNTELLAEIISDYLIHNKQDVEIRTFDFDPIDVDEINNYDAVIIGTHTWDDGELPYEVEDFYEELEEVNIADKIIAVFGSADSFYHTYGGAVDLIAERVTELGANVLPTRLKVDLDPDQRDVERCHEFAAMIMKALS